MKKLTFVFALIAVFGLNAIITSGQTFDPVLAQLLQNKIESFETQYNINNGISAAVIIPNGDTWTGTDGISTTTPSVIINSDMLFGIGSCTKNFTAALILKLKEQGLLNLDNPISNYIANLQNYPNINGSVTIRQLLNHTSGLGEYTNNSYFQYYTWTNRTYLFTNSDILNTVGLQQFTPGTSWQYCNTNFYLLGIIIENVTQQDLVTAYKTYLFNPLGLISTFLGMWDTIPASYEFAHGWGMNVVTYQIVDVSLDSRNSIWSGAGAAGCLVSTAENLARWAQSVFNGNVISQASINEMTNFNSNNYGLGLSKTTKAGRTVWGHTGAIPGYYSMFIYDPACNVSMAVLLNEENSNIESIVNDLFQLVVDNYCNVVSVKENALVNNNSLNVYPNPASSYIQIENGVNSNVYIYNILGELIGFYNISLENNKIDISDFVTGIYEVIVFNNANFTNKKFIKQ